MSGVNVIFHADYEKKSRQVEDQRVFKVVARKFKFLRSVGLNYPSLNAKQLNNEYHEGVPVWEFYITKKWRCLFTCNQEKNEIVVLKICNHL
jgi:hypothetical protein